MMMRTMVMRKKITMSNDGHEGGGLEVVDQDMETSVTAEETVWVEFIVENTADEPADTLGEFESTRSAWSTSNHGISKPTKSNTST